MDFDLRSKAQFVVKDVVLNTIAFFEKDPRERRVNENEKRGNYFRKMEKDGFGRMIRLSE